MRARTIEKYRWVWLAAGIALGLSYGSAPACAQDVKDHFDRGVALYKDKKTAQALDEFLAAQKAAPEDPTVLYWVGFINLQLKHYTEAVEPLEKAISLNKDAPDAHLNLGNVYDGLKRYPDAIKEFEIVSKLQPKSADPYYNIGGVYVKMQKPQDALIAYKKAAALDPKDPDIENSMGYVLQSMGSYDESVAAFKEAVRIEPSNPGYYVNLALALQEWAKKSPADAKSLRTQARETLGKGVAAVPNNYAVREAYGEALYDDGKVAESIPQFEKATELDPRQYDPLYNAGLAYSKVGNVAKAADAYRKALTVDPNSVQALLDFGMAEYKQNKYDDAIKAYDQLTKLTPADMEVWKNLSACYERKNDEPNAATTLENALKPDPKGASAAEVRRILAAMYYRRGGAANMNKAKDLYQRSLDDAPDNADALNGLGLISQKEHKNETAIGYFKRATAANPKFSDAFNNLGVAYEAVPNLDSAYNAYKKAVQLNPSNPMAKRNLARFKNYRPKS
jgi:tetratricopeptide (TPR) repeat protein